MRGLADALADPAGASETAMALVTEGDNPNYLLAEGEAFRWETESGLIRDAYAEGEPFGVPDLDLLQAEVDAYTEVGLFTEEPPELAGVVVVDVIAAVYDDEQRVIWPG